jgi:predicted secreted protein
MARTRALVGGLLAAGLAALPAFAEDPVVMNRVSFSVESTREVANDRVTASVSATAEDSDPARLADRINTDVAWGLGVAKGRPGVEVKSGGYRTWPVEDPRRSELRRWRGSQELWIEGSDAAQIAALLGELQARLQVQGVSFGVSPERRRAVEEELVDEALAAFRARAERVRKKLGASGYELVQVNVDAGGQPPGPMPMERGMLMAADAAVSPPALEGGTSTLAVHVHGSIELRF